MNEIIRATNYANPETTEGTIKIKGISYLLLGLTIFIAVSAAILTTDAIKWGVAVYAANIAIEKASQKIKADLKISAQRREAEERNRMVRDAEIARQQENYQAEQQRLIQAQKIHNENAAEAQKKKMGTCQFWIAEFNKSKSEGDKNHRDVSCRAAGMPFN